MTCQRFVHALYCDDVREEVGGKLTIVGAYQSNLLIGHLGPVSISMCIMVNVQTPKDQPFHKLTFTLLKDNDPIQVFEVDAGAPPEEQAASDDPFLYFNFVAVFKIPNISIEKDCTLRVKALADADELLSPGLRVRLQQS